MQDTTGISKQGTPTAKAFYFFAIILLVLVALGLFGLYKQLSQGLVVTGLRDSPGGTPWGLYVANSIFLEGIAAAGVIVVVATYLLKMPKYRPLVGVGLAITSIFLILAMMSLAFDVGRPERAPGNLLLHGRLQSPFVWDFAVLVGYIVLSLIGVYTLLRGILPSFVDRVSGSKQRVYRFFVGGIDAEESAKLSEGVMKWIAGGLLFYLVLLSGAIVPYIFGLIAARPSWYSAFSGGYFLLTSIAIGTATLIMVAATLQGISNWKGRIDISVLSGLGKFLLALILVYMLFVFSEQATYRFGGTAADIEVSEAMVSGSQSGLFWTSVILLIISLLVIAVTRAKSAAGLFIASTLAVASFWIGKLLVVTGSLLQSLLPYPEGIYQPTWIEWSITLGLVALGLLGLMAFMKLFPMIGLESNEEVVGGG